MRTLLFSSLLLVAAPALAQDKSTDTATQTQTTKRVKRLDINSASEDQLKTLPGVTDAEAKRIVAGRPYTSKDQLLEQNIVDKDDYPKIRPLIDVKQPKAIGGQGAVERHQGPGPATDVQGAKK